jgi:hypothetical protein
MALVRNNIPKTKNKCSFLRVRMDSVMTDAKVIELSPHK